MRRNWSASPKKRPLRVGRARSRDAELVAQGLGIDFCFMRSYRRCACFRRNVLLACSNPPLARAAPLAHPGS
jgi:hypothetical protein